MTTVSSSRVYLDEGGKACVNGHKVRMIAVDYVFNKWSPETIHKNFPDLSLADIHAALAYYYENKEAIDSEIEHLDKIVAESKAMFPQTTTRAELEARLAAKLQK